MEGFPICHASWWILLFNNKFYGFFSTQSTKDNNYTHWL